MKVFFAWYDFWIGFYYDRKREDLYICPLPCVVFKFESLPRRFWLRRCRHCRCWLRYGGKRSFLFTGVVNGKNKYTCDQCLDVGPTMVLP